MIKLYNSLSRKKETLKPLKDKKVGLYTCGPTVYDYAHIGNLRSYIFEDILKRSLEYEGFKVRHVMNITDVGHLISDEDEGEDKMAKALRREGKEFTPENILKIAEFYTEAFKKDFEKLNIRKPDVWCKATEHIDEQIEMIQEVMENGYAYETETAVYFDTQKLEGYTKLAGQDLKNLEEAVSVEKRKDKKNPTDFALWLKLVGKHKNHVMNWDSPWGRGFPGWHIECSAMSTKYLGEKFDIHCGGIDHLKTHHTNERAQNIAAFGHPVVSFWMHGEFLVTSKEKMSKSKGNFFTLQELEEKGFEPLAYRYLALTAHYRSPLSFSFEAMEGAKNSLHKLQEKVKEVKRGVSGSGKGALKYEKSFEDKIRDDLDIPGALAVFWEMIKDQKVKPENKWASLLKFDKILGLDLKNLKPAEIPARIKNWAEEREKLRKNKKFEKADRLRKKIKEAGFEVEDTKKGPKIKKRKS